MALYLIFLLFLHLSISAITTRATSLPSKESITVAAQNGTSYEYAYIYSAAEGCKPTFLLLHGFPSTSYSWHKQIEDLTTAGYGVLAPDLLGYGDTDKPTAPEEYTYSKMSAHIAKILDHEGLTEVTGVGHDWGSFLLGKFWNYLPQYFSSLVFMSVPYVPGAFDLDGLNAMTENAFGYPVFGYMYFMNETDSAQIISEHAASALSLFYPDRPELWRTDLCPIGKAKEWVTTDKTTPLPSWETQEGRDLLADAFEEGGWTGPTNWYKAAVRNLDSVAESQIPPANIPVTKPALFVNGDQDYATRVEVAQQLAQQGKEAGFLPTVEVKVVQGGSHWFMLEKSDEVFSILDTLAKSLDTE